MKNVIARSTNIKTGVYGPAHDPYGYSEYSMNTLFSDGSKESVTVHKGLDNWFLINGKEQDISDNIADQSFESQVGMSIGEFICMVVKAKAHQSERCPNCGSKKICGQKGFPGEYLYICTICKTTVDSEFDISAVT